METNEIIRETEQFIRKTFQEEGSGHDWWHIHRVREIALKIAKQEGADLFITEMAALLHDLDDWKLTGSTSLQPNQAMEWMTKMNLELTTIQKISDIIQEVSFKGAGVETKATSLEGKLVQDADRLDAIGAIGIARTFAYGGHKGRLIYDPEIKPEMHLSFEAYKQTTAPTINHFYEKLLLLKDLMNTESAKQMAEIRHQYMIDFLNQFYAEWNCIY